MFLSKVKITEDILDIIIDYKLYYVDILIDTTPLGLKKKFQTTKQQNRMFFLVKKLWSILYYKIQ